MPSRVIRGEINSSASLGAVSMQADLTFRALLVAVDDFGRMDARSDMLKAALFPTRAEATPAKIEKWLAELAVAGCVVIYEVKTDAAGAKVEQKKRYLALPNWEQHRGKQRRAAESRFPAPPEILGNPGDPGPLGGGLGVGGGDERDPRGSPRRSARSRSPVGATDPPERLSDEDAAKLIVWGDREGFTAKQCERGMATVLDWGRSNGKRKKSWLATVRNAMRAGWALEKPKGGGGGNSAGYRPPREFDPEPEAIQKRIAALESLKAEEDRAYSAPEVEARMEERDG